MNISLLATTNNEATGIAALGLDLKTIVFQIISFVIVVWILKKYVLSKLFAVIDARREELKAGLDRSDEAKLELEKAAAEAVKIFAAAHDKADEITAAAQAEAAKLASDIESKAGKKAERIVVEAREQLHQDVLEAKKALKKDTALLVAAASETVLGQKLDSKTDSSLIEKALEEAAKA